MGDPRTSVLFVLDSFPAPRAGTEIQVWLLARSLDPARFRIGFLLLGDSAFLAREMPDAPRYVVGARRLRSFAFWRMLMRSLRAARGDGFRLAHTWFNDSALALPVPLRLMGFTVIGSRRDLGFWYSPAILRLLRFNARFVDRVVCNSAAVRDEVMRQEGLSKAQTAVIYNGIARSSPKSGEVAAVRAKYGLPARAVVACLVANLRPLKRVEDAIEALARLAADVPPVHLAVVGEDRIGMAGSHRDALARLAKERGVSERVHFIGPLDDPMPLIHASDFGVLCSETEGFSNSLLEYFSANRPVVATAVGGNVEVVEEGVNGYLVPPRSPERLAVAFAALARSPELRAALGGRGRDRVESAFSPAAMTDAYSTLYLSLAGPAA